MQIWQNYFGDNIMPLYYALLRKRDPKEIEETITLLLSRIQFLVKHSKLSGSKDHYFMGPEFTTIDCSILPFLERISVVIKHYRKVDIWEKREEDESLKKLYNYWLFARQRTSFQHTLYDIQLQDFPHNELTKHLGMTSWKNYDPVAYMIKAYELYAMQS